MNEFLRIPRMPPSFVCGLSILGLTATFHIVVTPGRAQQGPNPSVAVVEEAAPGKVAAGAGLVKGDVISGWSSPTSQSSSVTPFDLIEIEVELAPRGAVILSGRRDGREMTWKLDQRQWGLTTRPVLPPRILLAYEEGKKRLDAKDYSGASAAWRDAASLPESADPGWLSPWLLSTGADALAKARQWQQTDEAFQAALERAATAGAMVRAQILESWAGANYRRDWAQARAHYEQSLEIRRAAQPETLAIANVTNSLGYVLRNMDDLAKAEANYREALRIAEQIAPSSLPVATYLNNVAFLVHNRGDLLGAEGLYRRGLAIRERVAPDSAYAVLNNLAAIAVTEGDQTQAAAYWMRALDARERTAPGSPEIAVIVDNLGMLAEHRGDAAAAEQYYGRALAINHKLEPEGLDEARSLEHLSALAWDRGDLNKVSEYEERASAIRQKSAPGSLVASRSLYRLAVLALKRGETEKSLSYHRQALAIREKLAPQSGAHADSLLALGAALRAAGETSESRRVFAAALDIVESRAASLDGSEEARSGVRSGYADDYREYVELLVDEHLTEAAFEAQERLRARSLLSMLATRDLVARSDLPAEIRQASRRNAEAYDQVQEQIAELSPAKDGARIESLTGRLRALSLQRDQITEQIRRASPRFAELQSPRPLNLDAARRALDSGTLLLSYSVGDNQTLLFALQSQNGELAVFHLPAGKRDLARRVEEFRGLIQQHSAAGRAALSERAGALYDLLLKPADALLSATTRLLIVPDGPLHVLPFAALRRGNQYLIEWKPVHTAVSATIYSEVKQAYDSRNAPAIELLAFGSPTYPATNTSASSELRSALPRGYTLAPLLFAREEVTNIAALFPNRSQIYTGSGATEERAKSLSAQARYIHFATHAFLDETLPLNSGLVLSIPGERSEGRENGLLQAWEVLGQMRLNADLVVLSACQTGLGAELNGEGLIGLTRAFQYAGARSILASLWSVDDRRTAELMKEFYRGLRNGRSKDEALRGAQLQLIRSNSSHPYYWAAFSLIGDWR